MLHQARAKARMVSDWPDYVMGVTFSTVMDCLCLGFVYKFKIAVIQQRDARSLKHLYASRFRDLIKPLAEGR